MAFKSYLRKNPNVFLAYQHMLLIKAETLTEFQSGITITHIMDKRTVPITVPVQNLVRFIYGSVCGPKLIGTVSDIFSEEKKL